MAGFVTRLISVVCTVYLSIQLCHCHLRLTYPIARTFQIDFLDNGRTTGPCGMPKGGAKTKLEMESSFALTWHLAYAHRGGYILEILDINNAVVHTLTGTANTWVGSTDTSTQSHEVTLPTRFTCNDCTIRVRRQASEWGPTYQFWSCADVEIVAQASFQPTCSGHGAYANGQCTCENKFEGDDCQYENDCVTNNDCPGGSCITVSPVSYPQKQCFCSPGKMGRNCEKVSPVTSLNYNPLDYKSRTLNDKFEILWKIVDTEIEVILKVESTSWVAIGWKPSDITSACRNQAIPDGGSVPVYNAAMHKMDCADIVIGSARGNQYRVLDYYTRDRSTPRSDVYWGGVDSITAAIGKEENGITTILFRKKLTSTDDPWDHSVTNADLTVIWARGQEIGAYIHSPPAGIESGLTTDSEFYKPDELKYHGHNPQRGSAVINFFAESSETGDCSGEWSTGCDTTGCDYKARWKLSGDSVTFAITARQAQTQWTGIGFAATQTMENADVILGWVNTAGVGTILDGWIGTKYSTPVTDTTSNLDSSSATYVDGLLTLTFSRKLDTTDSTQDHHFGGTDCWYFLYPTKGGPFTESPTKSVSQHTATPTVSSQKICIKPCEFKPDPSSEPESEPEPGAGQSLKPSALFLVLLLTILPALRYLQITMCN